MGDEGGGGGGGGISSGNSVGLGTPTIAPLLDGDIPSKVRSRAKGRLCKRHGAKSLATSPGEVKFPHQPTEGYEAMTAGGIARRGGEIGVNNLQTNLSTAAGARQSPSPRPSATTPDSSDDEELGAWIYRRWLRTGRSFANSVDESSPSSSTCESLHHAANFHSNMMGDEGGGGGGGGISSGNSVGSGSSNHSPIVGGGYAVAYEAACADHHRRSEEKHASKSKIKMKGGSNMNKNLMDDMVGGGMGVKNAMSGGGGGGGGKMPPFGLSVDPNQHGKILKLHLFHETQKFNTMVMKLYQQQQLQQQQQQQGVAAGKMRYYVGGGNRMGGQDGGGNQMGSRGNSNFLMGMMSQSQGTEGGGMGVSRMVGGGNHNTMAAPQSLHDNRRTSAHLDEFRPDSGSRRW